MLAFLDPSRKGSRREFLTVGGFAGLSMPLLWHGAAQGAGVRSGNATGKSVIFVMMQGGPSQFETWDPKPNAPSTNRCATPMIQTSVPGTQIGGTFHRIAKHAHRLAFVRSFTTGDGNHDIKPVVSRHSGGANLGSLYARVVGPLTTAGMPTNVGLFPKSVDPTGPGPQANFGNFLSVGNMGTASAPFVPGAGGPMQQNMMLNISRDRLDDRRALIGHFDQLRRHVDTAAGYGALDRIHEQAYHVMLSDVARAFDLSREDPRLIAKYDTAKYERISAWTHKNNRTQYGNHARSLGKQLLLARRLVEAGAGFVLVNTDFVWDMHQDVNNLGVSEGMDLVGTPFDHAISAFIDDVEARGLDEEILLVCAGEMGRTPRLQPNGGRDHWGRLASLMLYGGGLTHGQVIGQSSRDGGEPADNPQTIPNLISTIMHVLFNVPQLRLATTTPADLNRILADSPPIPGLF